MAFRPSRGALYGPFGGIEFRLDRHAMYRLSGSGAKRWMERAGPLVRADAKLRCPIDTGRLRASIDYRVLALGMRTGSPYVLQVYATQYYAVYVHEGTYKMRARPFLRQALDNLRGMAL